MIPALVLQEGVRLLCAGGVVDGQYRRVGVRRRQVVEVGQLLHAGRAIGGPEVDEDHMAAMLRQVELSPADQVGSEVRQLIAHIRPYRRVACGVGGGRGLDSSLGFSGDFGYSGYLGLSRRLGLLHSRRFSRRLGDGCGGGHLRGLLLLRRVDDVHPHQQRGQRDHGHGPGEPAGALALCNDLGGVGVFAGLGTLERQPAALQRDGPLGAVVDALAAGDALVVPHVAHVHVAIAHAGPAAVAAGGIHLHAGDGEAVEQSIDRAQRTQEPAEGAIAEHALKPNHQHDDELPRKQHLELVERGGVAGIGQQPHRALQRARRTDVLAECGQRLAVLNAVPDGHGDDEHRQDDVFQIRKRPGDPALPDLRRGDLVQQLLDQPQRAQPAADGAAQDQSVEHQDAQHIPRRGVARAVQGVLQRPQGTRADGPGAGIAVEAGHTDGLGVPGEDATLDEALQVGIVQERRVELRQPAGRGLMSAPPCFEISQVQHTPYRSHLPL